MATFVLVHGAWHGGWCWRRVHPLLAAKGPIASFEEKIRLTGALNRIARRTFILAADYNPSAFQGIAQRLRQDPSWTVIPMPCGHDVMVDMSGELADALMAAA